MQRLKQILQWQPCMGGGLDFSKTSVSSSSTANTGVATCLAFGSGVYFGYEQIWLLFVFFFDLKKTGYISCGSFCIQATDFFFLAILEPNMSIRCRNASIQDKQALLKAVRSLTTC